MSNRYTAKKIIDHFKEKMENFTWKKSILRVKAVLSGRKLSKKLVDMTKFGYCIKTIQN